MSLWVEARGWSRPTAPFSRRGLANIIDIAAGTKHAVALRKDGTVWADAIDLQLQAKQAH